MIDLNKIKEEAVANALGNIISWAIVGLFGLLGLGVRFRLLDRRILVGVSLVIVVGLVFRRRLSTVLNRIYAKIIVSKFYRARPKFVKTKAGDEIYLIDSEGKKKHIPELETLRLLSEILNLKIPVYREFSGELVNAIETGTEIPVLIKASNVFSERLDSHEAKRLLTLIYKTLLHRVPDTSGKEVYAPILEKEGFQGLLRVAREIKGSKEYSNL